MFVEVPEKKSARGTGGVCEPAMVLLPGGEIFALLRTADSSHYQSRSRDGGLSWDTPAPSPLVGHNSPSALYRLAMRDVLVVWNNSPLHRWPLDAAISTDGCKTWSKPRTLVNTPGFQSAYPTADSGRGRHVDRDLVSDPARQRPRTSHRPFQPRVARGGLTRRRRKSQRRKSGKGDKPGLSPFSCFGSIAGGSRPINAASAWRRTNGAFAGKKLSAIEDLLQSVDRRGSAGAGDRRRQRNLLGTNGHAVLALPQAWTPPVEVNASSRSSAFIFPVGSELKRIAWLMAIAPTNPSS